MRHRHSVRPEFARRSLALLGGALAALALPAAHADDLIGIYGGASIGQSRIETNLGTVGPGSFRENHSAWKVDFGIRPIPMVSAEAEFIEFGHPTGNVAGNPEDVDVKGTAAFGVFTLPIPVVDVFVKAGVARLNSTVNGALFHVSTDNTGFAAGAGVGYRMGPWGIRGEYERFNATGGNPSLYSVGFTYTFL